MAALGADTPRAGRRTDTEPFDSSQGPEAPCVPGLFFLVRLMTLSRDWLAVLAAALLILLVKLGIASGIPW